MRTSLTKGGVVIMNVICTHVPMSPRARTSVSDERSQNKVAVKVWSGFSEMLTGTLGDEQIYSVVLWDCCSSHQRSVIHCS